MAVPGTLLWVNGHYDTYKDFRASICRVPLPPEVA
jgi:hypothetical protein